MKYYRRFVRSPSSSPPQPGAESKAAQAGTLLGKGGHTAPLTSWNVGWETVLRFAESYTSFSIQIGIFGQQGRQGPVVTLGQKVHI